MSNSTLAAPAQLQESGWSEDQTGEAAPVPETKPAPKRSRPSRKVKPAPAAEPTTDPAPAVEPAKAPLTKDEKILLQEGWDRDSDTGRWKDPCLGTKAHLNEMMQHELPNASRWYRTEEALRIVERREFTTAFRKKEAEETARRARQAVKDNAPSGLRSGDLFKEPAKK